MFSFQSNGRVNISLQSGIDIGVAQDFAEGFGVKPIFNTACGEGVAKGVEGKGIQASLG